MANKNNASSTIGSIALNKRDVYLYILFGALVALGPWVGIFLTTNADVVGRQLQLILAMTVSLAGVLMVVHGIQTIFWAKRRNSELNRDTTSICVVCDGPTVVVHHDAYQCQSCGYHGGPGWENHRQSLLLEQLDALSDLEKRRFLREKIEVVRNELLTTERILSGKDLVDSGGRDPATTNTVGATMQSAILSMTNAQNALTFVCRIAKLELPSDANIIENHVPVPSVAVAARDYRAAVERRFSQMSLACNGVIAEAEKVELSFSNEESSHSNVSTVKAETW